MKRIAILGASGSIGSQTIEVIRTHKDKFKLISFSVYNNTSNLDSLLDEFKDVKLVAVKSINEIKDIANKYQNVKFVEGKAGLDAVATSKVDILVSALVGFIGLEPTLKAIRKGTTIALANKETLVAAGEIVTKEAKENNAKIIPIDSEHSAIYQCLEENNKIKKIILTCSGGPFFNKNVDLTKASVEDALNHPNWKMGAKITIDSATLFNKAFEVIEAYYLFGVKKEQIDVLIHPQSVIHSMIEYNDGAIKAQMGVSDMKLPIAYAMSNKYRLDNVSKSLDLTSVKTLEFYKADCTPIKLAYKALEIKGTYPTVLNAANEEAVRLFLEGKISFDQIEKLVIKALDNIKVIKKVTLDAIYKKDKEAREFVRRNTI